MSAAAWRSDSRLKHQPPPPPTPPPPQYYTEFGTQTFNLIYTSLPVLIMGIYDQDVDDVTSQRYPTLYDFTRIGSSMNVRVFLSVVIGALLDSIAVFFLCINGYYLPASYAGVPYVFQQVSGELSCTALAVVAGSFVRA